MKAYRAVVWTGSMLLLAGCAGATSEPPSTLCLAMCRMSAPPVEDPPAPPPLPAPPRVPVAVVFAGADQSSTALAKRLLETLDAEGRLAVVPSTLTAADLAGCKLGTADTNSCLSALAAGSKLPQHAIVLVEHPGWASRAAKVTCIGPALLKSREESIDLEDAFDARFEVSNPQKVEFTSCLIGSLHGPSRTQ